MKNLEECLKAAFSIEAKPKDEEVTLLGCVESDDRVRYVYEGKSGYWYENRYKVGNRIISEYEKIFEHPEPPKYQRAFYAIRNQAVGEIHEQIIGNNKRQGKEETGTLQQNRNVC